MWFSKKVVEKDNRLLHEKYPELLEWEIDDFIKPYVTLRHFSGYYKGVVDNYIVVDCNGSIYQYNIEHCWNDDLHKRKVFMKLETQEYNKYLMGVQKAVKQIKEELYPHLKVYKNE